MSGEANRQRAERIAAIRIYTDSERVERAITAVVASLPDEVQRDVATRCVFVAADRDTPAFVLPGGVVGADDRLVVLSDRLEGDDLTSAIAHEIAHVVLGHPPIADLFAETVEHEDEASEQVRRWGYTRGIGAARYEDRVD